MYGANKKVLSGEYALLVSLLLNSFGVELQVKSGVGISCISSVSYVFSRVFPQLTFGTWNYLIQIFVLALLVVLTRRFKVGYLVSLALSVAFGSLLDVYGAILPAPTTLFGEALCYAAGLFVVCFSIWMLQRCLMPILPFDAFVRDMTERFHLNFRRFKTGFDLTCLAISVTLSLVCFGRLQGLGIGTVAGALFTGSIVSSIAAVMDRRVTFRLKHRSMRVFA